MVTQMLDFLIKPPADFIPMGEEVLRETIIPQFERTVAKYPEKVAIKDEDGCITYQELNNKINIIAHRVLELSPSLNYPIAFLVSPEVKAICTKMAILKTGGFFVALHPGNSIHQLKAYLDDSSAKVLIYSTEHAKSVEFLCSQKADLQALNVDEIDSTVSVGNPNIGIAPNAPFGIFYTSGSTGKPKGVLMGHLCRSQTIHYQTNEACFSPSDKVALVTSIYFLLSHANLFGALLNGGQLCLFDVKKHSARQAVDWIIHENLTVFRSTPSIFRTIFSAIPEETVLANLRFMTLGGEPISSSDIELYKRHTSSNCVLINNYSASEAGIICYYPITHDLPEFSGFLPAGYPAPGKEIFIENDEGKVITTAEPGEICVQSRYLCLGYWNQNELNEQKFSKHPTDPEMKIYHTGDIGRFNEKGILEVLGRKDTQVKIRGYRMQLEYIDAVIRSVPGVVDSATIVKKDAFSGERLVTYYVNDDDTNISIDQLRQELTTQLPTYMIPSTFVRMPALPRTPTGKVSRKDLPEPAKTRPALDVPYNAPASDFEKTVVQIWEKILQVEGIGIDDNFFDLGGDSLNSIIMSVEVENIFHKKFPQSFFTKPTIRNLGEIFNITNGESSPPIKFQVSSYKKDHQSSQNASNKKKQKVSFLNKILTHRYTNKDISRAIDKIVSRYIMMLSYEDALNWSVRWSQNPVVQKYLYRDRKVLFRHWLEELTSNLDEIESLFKMNILTNMFFRLPKAANKKHKIVGSELINYYKQSRYKYWRSLGYLIEGEIAKQDGTYFPFKGFDYLESAYKQGKGVILLSFHGTPSPGRFYLISRKIGVEEIPTISYQIPIRQSKFAKDRTTLTDKAITTMNSEIAIFGQNLLKEGKIIHFASDTDDTVGRTYQVTIGERIYHLKGGFAEMALNTGAIIIPFHRYCLPDGRVQTEFFQSIEVQGSSYYEKVEFLVNQYAHFIEQCWKSYPESLSWTRMDRHLKRPSK